MAPRAFGMRGLSRNMAEYTRRLAEYIERLGELTERLSEHMKLVSEDMERLGEDTKWRGSSLSCIQGTRGNAARPKACSAWLGLFCGLCDELLNLMSFDR